MKELAIENQQKLSLFNYLDYRHFLKDFYSFQKNKHSGYSFRVFAMKAKLSSQNYLKLVIDGKRRITDKALPAFIRGLSLNKEEAKYFRLLVLFNETKDLTEKRELLSKIVEKRNRQLTQTKLIREDQEQILHHWSHWVIREMVLLDEFKWDAKWICEQLDYKISPKQAQESLDLLLKTGLVEKKGERFVPSDLKITTNDEVTNHLLRDLHTQLIELGLKSLFKDQLSSREFAGVTIALTDEQVPKFKKRIKQFRRDMNAEFSSSDEKPSKVFHLELMFYPVSKGRQICHQK